jgi:chromosome partitioning protein
MVRESVQQEIKNMTHIIAVLNQKGGVGKTTTAVNVGAFLAKNRKSVLLVDFDPQGNATSGLGLEKNNLQSTIYDALVLGEPLDATIHETKTANMNIVVSNAGLAAAEIDLANKQDREQALKKLLKGVDYDYIIIDCPPALGLLTINALTAAHTLLIPVQAEYYALEGLSQLLSVVQRVKQGLNTELDLLGVVVTMYDGRTSLSEQVYEELKKFFGEKVFNTVIPRNIRLAEAPSHGKPIMEHDKWSKGARAYKQLTKEVIERVG